MQDKIFELIHYGLFLLIGFSLGKLWVGRSVTKKLKEIKKMIDEWSVKRHEKFEEIEKSLNDLRKTIQK